MIRDCCYFLLLLKLMRKLMSIFTLIFGPHVNNSIKFSIKIKNKNLSLKIYASVCVVVFTDVEANEYI